MKPHLLPTIAALLLACSSNSANPPADTGVADQGAADADTVTAACPTATRTVNIDPATAAEADVQRALASAQPGDVIALGEGTLKFTNTLTLSTSCVTIRGAGMDKTVLDFAGQTAGSDGVYGDRTKHLLLEGFTVRDTRGNAIKVLSGEDVTFRKLRTEWNGADKTAHGAYGLYPVSSTRVLIEDCVATDASDSGIYVGQSDQVVVRRNRAEQNVAGIEIENTFNADVYDNVATKNTAGVLVFDLPGLPQLGGHHIRVFKNDIRENNTENFAPKGNIVGVVPAGVGFFVMANHDVEVFENTFTDNHTVHSAVVSYYVTQLKINDAKYYPYPSRIHIHDNTYAGGGGTPDTDRELGVLLEVNRTKFPGGVLSYVLYDGIVDDKRPAGDNPMEICVQSAGENTFANLHLDQMSGVSFAPTFDVQKHACALAALPAITWNGLTP
jgi:parallel beta-helix repeat protein